MCLHRTVISVPCFSVIGRFHSITIYNSFRPKFAMINWPILVETEWSVCTIVRCPNWKACIVDTQPESTAYWLPLLFISYVDLRTSDGLVCWQCSCLSQYETSRFALCFLSRSTTSERGCKESRETVKAVTNRIPNWLSGSYGKLRFVCRISQIN